MSLHVYVCQRTESIADYYIWTGEKKKKRNEEINWSMPCECETMEDDDDDEEDKE